MMLSMAKKKDDQSKAPAGQPPSVTQHSLRFYQDDAALLAALDHFATRARQTRSAAILSLLEEALRGKGFYPPAPEARKDGGGTA
jgi:hypothetical protein